MSILIIAVVSWATLEVIKALRARHLERKRIEERNRRDAEIRRLAEAHREAQRKAKEEHLRIIEMQREQARQAKEQEKQAVLLEKHEKRISDLEFKVAKVERNIEDIDEKLADYYAQLDSLLLLQSGTVPGSKQFDSYQSKIVTKRGQIRREETKRFELLHTRDMAQKELEVA